MVSISFPESTCVFNGSNVLSAKPSSHTLPVLNKSFIEGLQLLTDSAHIQDTLGSPGTILFIPSVCPDKIDALVVTRLGQVFTQEIAKDDRINDSFITKILLGGMEDLIGHGPLGILFLSEKQIENAKLQLADSIPGTYLTYAHTPIGQGSEAKRNLILWMNESGLMEEACFHFDPQCGEWFNGGPIRDRSPPYPTLSALISKKIPYNPQPLRVIGE